MKALKHTLGLLLMAALLFSCTREVLVSDNFITASAFNTEQVLQSFDLWYVDIHATQGRGEVPFLQRAFTVSFDRGTLYANNNIVGIGKTGGGLGIDVGFYRALNGAVEVDHDVDGLWTLEIFAVDRATLELYDPRSDTSYFLIGYQRNTFDYDRVFYENINYLVQEYDAWEKTFTSNEGAINDFDRENYLQFLPSFFRSSVDLPGTPIGALQWDFEGNYQVYDVANDPSLKTLTLEYDFMGNDYFELYVINDSTIELYHPDSGTVYEFKGRGYQQYLKRAKGTADKKRKKINNPTMRVKRSRASVK
ncbi:nicotinic acid mononucleotide adenyltransferase [Maribacter sp. 2307ULW6-5]|uniref:nicotinic acid mononucleotide adenyltransferase n=1 Tax=Maribacter sp. 2307ULW6-5 TaxID=3386275 RepID=UPI0039BD61E0